MLQKKEERESGEKGERKNKQITINCLGADDLWSLSGLSRGVTVDFQMHLSCGFGSFLFPGFRLVTSVLTSRFSCLPCVPSTVHLWRHLSSPPYPPPPAPHSEIISQHLHFIPFRNSEGLNTLNVGTSAVLLQHLTQCLGDLKAEARIIENEVSPK